MTLKAIKEKALSCLMNNEMGRKMLLIYYKHIKQQDISIADIQSVRQFIKDSGEEYHTIEPSGMRKCIIYRDENGEVLYKDLFFPETYVGVVKDVYIRSASDCILVKGKVLCDRIEDTFHPYWTFPCNNQKEVKCYCVKKKKALLQKANPDANYERGIDLVYRYPWNYWHVCHECISKLYYIEQFDEYSDWPIIVDELMLADASLKELLDILNIHQHPLIVVEKGKIVHVNEVIYAPCPMTEQIGDFLPKDFHEVAQWWTIQRKEVIEWVRKCVFEKYGSFHPTKRVFVMRGRNDRLINEEEVAAILGKNGFECTTMEGKSLLDEVRLFAEAQVILFIHGAAMTNVMYCSQGAKVYQICPDCFLSQQADHYMLGEYIGFKADIVRPVIKEMHNDLPSAKYKLSIDEIDRFLKKVCEEND